MKTLPMFGAAAVLALMAAPAFAQTMPSDSMPPAPLAASPMAAPAATDAATPASATVPGSVTVQTVTNGPVPDTPEMRAKYKPLSHAGRHSKPAGN